MDKRFALVLVVVAALGLSAGAGTAAYQQGSQASPSAQDNAPALALLAPTVAGSQATPAAGPAGGRPILGTIQKVDANGLTLQTQSGATTRVALGEGTTVTRVEQGTTADLAVGASVVVTGQQEGDAVAASAVQVLAGEGEAAAAGIFGQAPRQSGAGGNTGALRQMRLSGKVQAVEGQTLTIATATGTSKVTLTTATGVQRSVPGSLADLHEGQSVLVLGEAAADGAVAARSIQIIPSVGRAG